MNKKEKSKRNNKKKEREENEMKGENLGCMHIME